MNLTIKPQARFWLSRLIVSLEVLVLIVAVSWWEPNSLTSKALAASGSYSWLLLAALGGCCLMVIADVIVNDLMPQRFAFHSAMRWRHLGLMGTALLLGIISVLVVFSQGFTVLLFAYWLNASLAVGLAFLDVFTRLRQS